MFRVKCPQCGGVLVIDERLRRVVDHVNPAEAARDSGERLQGIVEKIQKDKSSQDERLEAAKQRERERKSHLEDVFKKAQQKAKDAPDDGKPRGPIWD